MQNLPKCSSRHFLLPRRILSPLAYQASKDDSIFERQIYKLCGVSQTKLIHPFTYNVSQFSSRHTFFSYPFQPIVLAQFEF